MISALAGLEGVIIVAQTPFDDVGAVDLESIATLSDFYFDRGAYGLTILGVAGEASKLDAAESVSVVREFVRHATGRPIIVGVSGPNVAQTAALCKESMDCGASGVMVAPPGFVKTEDDLLNYFEALYDKAGPVPTVLQDFPFASGVWMSASTILRLASRFTQICAVKEEDVPSLPKVSRLRAAAPQLSVLTGNNAMYLPLELARGCQGPMSGFSHPEAIADIYRAARAGETEHAETLFEAYLPLLNYENQGQWGVAIRKEILRRRGAIRNAAMRYPAPKLGAQEHAEIEHIAARVYRRLRLLGIDNVVGDRV